MSSAGLRESEARRDPGLFPKRKVALVRGEGARLWDAEGNAYLDFGATHGVSTVGHCHPRVVRAVQEQAARLMHVAASWPNDQRAALLDDLAAIAPAGLDRAFLCNSGTEAMEAAIKFARGHTHRPGLVAAQRGFHGRTMGALALTHKAEYRAPFLPMLPGVGHVPYGDVEALKAAVTRDTAAVVLEPIQGEAGVVLPPPGYLGAARDLCTDAGALLVADEVQTGFGRTGRVWAVEHESVVPDILAFGKGVAGGLPMGGILLRSEVCTLPPGSHGSTFGGSPIVCAAARAAIGVLRDEGLAERASQLGDRLLAGLGQLEHAAIREVRGRGLMVGLELRTRNGPVLEALLANGVIALPTGTSVVRYLPPLVVSHQDVDVAIAATAKALAALPGS
ncbi:MAG TPA: aspartate aminotransferase family protein [Candidatus Thermoplasmatota archaeon]|nr:aspartate aminotransferase family protein [Candidatus Thermoplasmatota archaeon]